MSILKKVTSAALALTLAAGMSVMPVSAAAADMENGNYTATVHFHKEGTAPGVDNLSMCDYLFAREAEVELTDDSAIVTIYVAYPIPNFPDQGTDGTLKDVVLTYDGADYTTELDIDTKAEKYFDSSYPLFGINEGDVLPTEAMIFTLPRVAVDSFGDGFDTTAFVNSVMNQNQSFVVRLTDLQAAATEVTEQSATVTADVAAASASYSVTIPESIAMGTLSAETDNTREFTVDVTAANLGTGKVKVASASTGELKSGENTLAFANSFGEQTATESTSLTGTITVTAADVAAAASGNYTGTANFTISYYAE